MPLTWQWLFAISQRIRSHCNYGRIFRQLVRINFVERIGGGVMIVEIEAAVLDRAEIRHAELCQRIDVGAGLLAEREQARAGILQTLRRPARGSAFTSGLPAHVDAERMTGAAVGLDRGEMVRDISLL